jgi:hypothetical protein
MRQEFSSTGSARRAFEGTPTRAAATLVGLSAAVGQQTPIVGVAVENQAGVTW